MTQILGRQELAINSRICGTFEVLRVEALPALYPRLGLRVAVTLRELLKESPRGIGQMMKDFDLVALGGELRLQENGPAVGLLHLADDQRATSREMPSSDEMLMACDLDERRLEAIERARDGRPPVFWVQLWPVAVMNGRRLNGKLPAIRIEVPRDAWVEFLRAVGFRDKVILELAIPEFATERFQEAALQLRRAQDHLLEGRVEQSMSDCRVVWEAIQTELGDDGKNSKLRALLTDRVGKVRADAYMSILSQTKDLASAPGHLYGARAPSIRIEAQVLLGWTASLLALVTELAAEAFRPSGQAVAVEQS